MRIRLESMKRGIHAAEPAVFDQGQRPSSASDRRRVPVSLILSQQAVKKAIKTNSTWASLLMLRMR